MPRRYKQLTLPGLPLFVPIKRGRNRYAVRDRSIVNKAAQRVTTRGIWNPLGTKKIATAKVRRARKKAG